jgi:hypothetical protein
LVPSTEKSSQQNIARDLGMVVCSCSPSTWEAETGELQVKVQPELRSKTLSPNRWRCDSSLKTGGGVTQVAEPLPGKCRAMNLNPSTIKNKKEIKKN